MERAEVVGQDANGQPGGACIGHQRPGARAHKNVLAIGVHRADHRPDIGCLPGQGAEFGGAVHPVAALGQRTGGHIPPLRIGIRVERPRPRQAARGQAEPALGSLRELERTQQDRPAEVEYERPVRPLRPVRPEVRRQVAGRRCQCSSSSIATLS